MILSKNESKNGIEQFESLNNLHVIANKFK